MTRTTGHMLYWLMAAYTIVFYTLIFVICAIMVYYEKTLTKNKKTCIAGLEPPTTCFTGNGYLHHRLLHTPVDERWVLQTCENKLCVPQRHSFHFEQVRFRSMHRLLSYQRAKNADGQTDRQTDSFSALYNREDRRLQQ